MLDIFGDEKVFGKKIGGDIIANKKTYLLIKALEMADNKTKKDIENLLELNFVNNKKITDIKNIYNKLNIQKLTQDKIAYFYKIAINALSNADISVDAKDELIKFAQKLIKRNK